MSYILLFTFLVLLPGIILCCKSKPIKPPCPDGYWKVPNGWKCHGDWLDPLKDMIHCANDYECMNSAYLCDGRRSIRREDTYSWEYGWNNSDANYPDGSPDENMCTDEFCSSLTDGRTRRCPGTTRCISPSVNYPSTDIPIGPICKEELFPQFQPIIVHFDNGSTKIQCQNGEMSEIANLLGGAGGFSDETKMKALRATTASLRCTQKEVALCSDHSDVTAETCAWACLHYSSQHYVNEIDKNDFLWPCPGEAKCIESRQICDGVKNCGKGQDEDENLCTEEFCRNGYVLMDTSEHNWTREDDVYGFNRYQPALAEIKYYYLFDSYRHPNYPPNQMDYYRENWAVDDNGNFSMARLQNMEMPKCKNSTKCLRRSVLDDDSGKWIEC